MAGKGPAPKPAKLRQRRNKKAGRADLEAPTAELDRSLPDLGDGAKWHPLTLQWWAHIWESPMAGEYLQTDIDGLGRLAILVDAFYKAPSKEIIAEIRLQEARFGLSPVDRSRLQWEVQKGEEAARRRKPQEPNIPKSGKDPRGILGVVK